MRTIGAIFLFLIALLTGGCSLVFSSFLLQGGVYLPLFAIWSSGLVIAALCIWGGIKLLR